MMWNFNLKFDEGEFGTGPRYLMHSCCSLDLGQSVRLMSFPSPISSLHKANTSTLATNYIDYCGSKLTCQGNFLVKNLLR